jgi:hypothetical protein
MEGREAMGRQRMNPTDTTSITAFIPHSEIRVARSGKEHPVLVVLDGRRTCRRYEIKKQEEELRQELLPGPAVPAPREEGAFIPFQGDGLRCRSVLVCWTSPHGGLAC